MAVDQQVRGGGRLRHEVAPVGQQPRDMALARGHGAGDLLDHVVEPQLQLRVLAEATERLRHGPVRIEDGQDVAHAGLAMPDQLLDAADGDPEGRYRFH